VDPDARKVLTVFLFLPVGTVVTGYLLAWRSKNTAVRRVGAGIVAVVVWLFGFGTLLAAVGNLSVGLGHGFVWEDLLAIPLVLAVPFFLLFIAFRCTSIAIHGVHSSTPDAPKS
jgi:hypothetical protein